MAASSFSPASQVIQRHESFFTDKKVLITGDIQDNFPNKLNAKQVNIFCTQFHTYLRLKQDNTNANIEFGLLPEVNFYQNIDTLIYYWPKTKSEAQFQLSYLLHNLPVGSDIFVVGENRSGVKSVENLLVDFGSIQKIDSARRCGLYHFQATTKLAFDINEWWQNYQLSIDNCDIQVKSLPGVFSSKSLDAGSDLLLNCLFERHDIVKGNILDVGSGAGVIATVLGKCFNDINLTLTDVNSVAIESSKATLESNQLTGQVVASDVFSNIQQKYHLIVSNPPFHDGLETSYFAADNLIKQAKKHLKLNGYLCIVANTFLPYRKLLDQTFRSVEVIAKTTKFVVYLASH